MFHWIKQKLFYVKNVEAPSSKREFISVKPQDSLQEQDKQHTSQSQSLRAKNAGTSILNSYQKRLRTLGSSIYSGIQDQIYD